MYMLQMRPPSLPVQGPEVSAVTKACAVRASPLHPWKPWRLPWMWGQLRLRVYVNPWAYPSGAWALSIPLLLETQAVLDDLDDYIAEKMQASLKKLKAKQDEVLDEEKGKKSREAAWWPSAPYVTPLSLSMADWGLLQLQTSAWTTIPSARCGL